MKKLDNKIKEIFSQKIIHTQKFDNMIKDTMKIISEDTYHQKSTPQLLYKIPKIAAIIVICLGVTSIASYTGFNIYKQNIKKNYTYSLNENMTYIEKNISYKKIFTYEEYLYFLNMDNNLIQMSKEDFNENFLLLITFEAGGYGGLYIENISTDQNTTYIKLKKSNIDKTEYITGNYILSTIIPKELEREKIDIEIIPGVSNKLTEFTNLENVTKDYIYEQCFKEGCIVIENNALLSNNKDKLDLFVENTKNNINSTIRTVMYGNYIGIDVVVQDIMYIDGIYYINTCDILEDGTRNARFFVRIFY